MLKRDGGTEARREGEQATTVTVAGWVRCGAVRYSIVSSFLALVGAEVTIKNVYGACTGYTVRG